MPRPKKNNADYFPHYNGMRNHRKIKMLRNKFGAVLGYAFWCMMLEWLTEHDGLEWEFSDIEIEMLASELGVNDVEISNMIAYSIKIELLFKNAENFIYSESLNENLSPVFEKRKTAKEISKTRQRRDNGSFLTKSLGISVAETIVTATEIPQSKVEYSKVKKSIVKEFVPPLITEISAYFFENGYSVEAAQRAFNYYSASNWIDSKGKPVKNWKQKMVSVWFKDENKIVINDNIRKLVY